MYPLLNHSGLVGQKSRSFFPSVTSPDAAESAGIVLSRAFLEDYPIDETPPQTTSLSFGVPYIILDFRASSRLATREGSDYVEGIVRHHLSLVLASGLDGLSPVVKAPLVFYCRPMFFPISFCSRSSGRTSSLTFFLPLWPPFFW